MGRGSAARSHWHVAGAAQSCHSQMKSRIVLLLPGASTQRPTTGAWTAIARGSCGCRHGRVTQHPQLISREQTASLWPSSCCGGTKHLYYLFSLLTGSTCFAQSPAQPVMGPAGLAGFSRSRKSPQPAWAPVRPASTEPRQVSMEALPGGRAAGGKHP